MLECILAGINSVSGSMIQGKCSTNIFGWNDPIAGSMEPAQQAF